MNAHATEKSTITALQVLDRARSLYAEDSALVARKQLLRPRILPFEKLLPYVKPGYDLLDIGCGGGLFLGLAALSSPGLSAVGIDNSASAIACAARMAARKQFGNLSFQVASRPDEWPKERFQMVSFIDVLHHIPRTQRAPFFQNAAARVEKGGFVLCKDMRQRPRWRAAANVLHDFIATREWIHHAGYAEVESWGKGAGLKLTHYEEWDRLWYGHALWLFQRPM